MTPGRTASRTVTVQESVFPPSSVVTVMVAVPAARAVTTPVLETEATSGRSLLHCTPRLAASSGWTEAFRAAVSPASRVRLDLSRLTEATGTGLGSGSGSGLGSGSVGSTGSGEELSPDGRAFSGAEKGSGAAARAAGSIPASRVRARRADRSRKVIGFMLDISFRVLGRPPEGRARLHHSPPGKTIPA